MYRVYSTARGMVTSVTSTRGGQMTTIMMKEPVTVTRLVRMLTMSAEIQVLTTSMS